jgi:hypothetical protein
MSPHSHTHTHKIKQYLRGLKVPASVIISSEKNSNFNVKLTAVPPKFFIVEYLYSLCQNKMKFKAGI